MRTVLIAARDGIISRDGLQTPLERIARLLLEEMNGTLSEGDRRLFTDLNLPTTLDEFPGRW